jgi:F420-dependent methylenetetrahydromethanopterin dehydrogenase
VAQRSIELFIGRLVTDEDFRATFMRNPSAAVALVVEAGHELTNVEVAALLATRADLWERVADQIDARLQKVSLQSFARSEG